jgi:tetratricopeptide (TPR) repeat protein
MMPAFRVIRSVGLLRFAVLEISMRRIIHSLFLILLSMTVAHAEEGLPAFDQGMQAFRSGDYSQAAQAFEQARSQGLKRPALFYNLGVTYYRLARWQEAREAFLKTAETTAMAPLAYYNLGLVSRKQNDASEAVRWFERCLATSQDEKLRILAQHALAGQEEKRSAWSTLLNIGLGYDDNVTLESDSLVAVSDTSDLFFELFGYSQGLLMGSHQDGLLFKGSLFGDLYLDETDYSLVDMNLGLYKTFRLQSWHNEAGAYLSYSTLGGDSYTRSANLSLNARRDLSEVMSLRLRMRLRQIWSLDKLADAIEGNSSDYRVEGQWRLAQSARLRGYYELELNDRQDSETATTFASLSPTRHTVYADYRFPLTQTWEMKLSGSYRLSEYNDANLEAGGELIDREDDRLKFGIEVNRPVGKRSMLLLEYSYTDNSSNIDRYSYQRNLLMANMLFEF